MAKSNMIASRSTGRAPLNGRMNATMTTLSMTEAREHDQLRSAAVKVVEHVTPAPLGSHSGAVPDTKVTREAYAPNAQG